MTTNEYWNINESPTRISLKKTIEAEEQTWCYLSGQKMVNTATQCTHNKLRMIITPLLILFMKGDKAAEGGELGGSKELEKLKAPEQVQMKLLSLLRSRKSKRNKWKTLNNQVCKEQETGTDTLLTTKTLKQGKEIQW